MAATKRTQVGDEHDDGEGTLSLISNGGSAGVPVPKFSGAHLFTGHEGTVVPAKQQLCSAQRKEPEEL